MKARIVKRVLLSSLTALTMLGGCPVPGGMMGWGTGVACGAKSFGA
jgi:hypothetical protein